jgi:hypothetical protein
MSGAKDLLCVLSEIQRHYHLGRVYRPLACQIDPGD